MMPSVNKAYFAEVLQSSIATFQAQSWQWDSIPEFGSLVCVTSGQRTIFAIIYDITTGPTDPIRQPVTYQKTEEELHKEQPQIFEFLTTSFSCIAIGYSEQKAILYNLPSQPIKMHAFVRYATSQEYQQCFASEHFLYLLCNTQEQFNIEELLLAIVKHQLHHNVVTQDGLSRLMETFFTLHKNNYVRIKIFLSRLQELLKHYAFVAI